MAPTGAGTHVSVSAGGRSTRPGRAWRPGGGWARGGGQRAAAHPPRLALSYLGLFPALPPRDQPAAC